MRLDRIPPIEAMFNHPRSRLTAFLFVLICMSLTQVVQADIYKWKDASGRTHFSDRKPAQLDISPLKLKINSYQSVRYGSSNGDKSKHKGSRRKVVMYSTDWCGYCKQARRYFTQQSIPFTEYDIEKNARAQAQYAKLGATGVPVILVNKKRMNGFSVKGFRKIYD